MPREPKDPDLDADPINDARAELEVMRELLDILEPFTDEERARILSCAAAHLGQYNLAIAALLAAKDRAP